MADDAPLPERRDDAPQDAWGRLMARAQEGDRDSYRVLLQAVTPYIRAIAARALRERADVEDTVQDILVTLHRIRASYDPARPFRPWLAGIARHRVLDRLRARGRRAVWEVAWDPVHETIAAEVTNSDKEGWDGQALRAAMATLSPGQRQAIEMTKLREMSVREASAASGMTEGALKVAVHRGLARLRVLLGGRETPR